MSTTSTITSRRARRGRGIRVLVSTAVGPELRTEVGAGTRPRPEFLAMESDHNAELLDWTALGGAMPTRRSIRVSLQHAAAALKGAGGSSALLSDGEHLGLPIAAALSMIPRRPRHVMIAHHLTTDAKRRLLRVPGLMSGIDCTVVHSQRQYDLLVNDIGVSDEKIRLIRYGIDTSYWTPQAVPEERLIASAGREHRDYASLAAAVQGIDARVFVADGSAHSPQAQRELPVAWPPNVERGTVQPEALRTQVARAAVVVVPLVETDFPAGITVILEAMSMGKALVVTRTKGLEGALADPEAVTWAPTGDADALQRQIQQLLDNPRYRVELGRRARQAAIEHHDVSRFAAELADLANAVGPT